MEQLTRAEEQVMQVLWKLGKGFAKDVLAELPKPKPVLAQPSSNPTGALHAAPRARPMATARRARS